MKLHEKLSKAQMGFSQKLLKEFPREFLRNRLQNYKKKTQVIAKEISRRDKLTKGFPKEIAKNNFQRYPCCRNPRKQGSGHADILAHLGNFTTFIISNECNKIPKEGQNTYPRYVHYSIISSNALSNSLLSHLPRKFPDYRRNSLNNT